MSMIIILSLIIFIDGAGRWVVTDLPSAPTILHDLDQIVSSYNTSLDEHIASRMPRSNMHRYAALWGDSLGLNTFPSCSKHTTRFWAWLVHVCSLLPWPSSGS